MGIVERIETLQGLLVRHGDAFLAAIQRSGQQNDPQAIAMRRALDFGRNTLESITTLLRLRNDVAGSVALCRSFYELGLRVRWASHHDYGWFRFMLYYADNEHRWATQVRDLPGFEQVADRILSVVSPLLENKAGPHAGLKPMPKYVREVLRDLERPDKEKGLIGQGDQQHPEFEYAALYSVMCRPAHGNVFSVLVGFPGPEPKHLVVGAALAVYAVLRALAHCMATDERKERETAEKVGSAVIEVIRGAEKLNGEAANTMR
jgi:hypothetical protein